MAWLKYNKKYDRYYICDKNGKCACRLGKITKEQAQRELELFKKQYKTFYFREKCEA
jgi:hypothetical protein